MEQHHDFAKLLLNAPFDGAYLVSPDGVILFASEAGASRVGMTPEAMVGLHAEEFLPADLAVARMSHVATAIATRRPLQFEDERADRVQLSSLYPVLNEAGEVTAVAVYVRDVTEQREAERALGEATRYARDLESLIGRSAVVIFRWRNEPGFPMELVTDNVKRLGYRPEDLLSGRVNWVGITHADDVERLQRELEEHAAAGRDEFPMDYRVLDRDGSVHWMTDHTRALRDGDGNITHYESVVLDVTERRRADEALRAAGARWEALVDAAPAIITLMDTDGTIRFINRRPSGAPRDAAVGASLYKYLLPEWHQPVRTALDEVAATGNTVEFRTSVELPDHRTLHFENVAGPVRDGNELTGAILVSSDISQRILRERELEVSEAKFRSIFEGGAVGMAIVGMDTRLVEVNQALCDMLGYAREEMLSMTIADVTYPEDLDVDADQRPALLEGSIPSYSLEKRYVRKDGSLVWALLSASVIRDAGGAPQFLLGQAQDLTEQRAAEERRLGMERRLQQGQRLEALGALAGGVAHEFNNILTAVMGRLELAREGLPAGSAAAEELVAAEQAALRAADLARQMHAMSGRRRLVAEELDLGEALRQFARVLQASLPPSIRFDVHMRVGLLVDADLAQIQQAVAGLVANAAEALGDGGGEVTLAVGCRHFTHEDLGDDPLCEGMQPGEYATLQVADDGPGMEENVREHAFEPFFTTHLPGRGLGLPAVLGIARSHGGGMSVECGAGGGTRVTIILPLSHRAHAGGVPDERRTGSATEGLVLLVDDEDVVRRVGERMLATLGYECLGLADGAEAIAMLEDASVQVRCVVLDLTMPGMDGVAVLREMEERGIRVPVVVCSGYTDRDMMERVEGMPSAAFLQKPYRKDELRVALEQALAP